jgi:soluble lytic murein transglycosylase-like protein
MAFDYEYTDEESWASASRRKRFTLIGFVLTATVTLLVGLGAVVYAFGAGGPAKTKQTAANGSRTPEVSAEAVDATTSAGPAPTDSPTPARTPSKSPSAKPKTSLAPPKETKLPPPPSLKPAPPGCKPSYVGTNAPKSQVRASLDAAAAYTFWKSTPQVKLSTKLLYAVAWQESGWQSAIRACDGGIGTMQVMPDTATWMNQRFGTKWDVNALDGNVKLGGQYLAWLTKYFGDQLGSYDLDAEDAILLRAVISAYNFGFGAVDLDALRAGTGGIPNVQYVANVRSLMKSCPCTST